MIVIVADGFTKAVVINNLIIFFKVRLSIIFVLNLLPIVSDSKTIFLDFAYSNFIIIKKEVQHTINFDNFKIIIINFHIIINLLLPYFMVTFVVLFIINFKFISSKVMNTFGLCENFIITFTKLSLKKIWT